MATIDVKDAAGSTVAIEKPLAPGRAAAGASRPVALSTEDLAAIEAITAKLIAAPATAAIQTANGVLLGAVAETAPASDTASSGLNGRLQRIAQRLTTLLGAGATTIAKAEDAASADADVGVPAMAVRKATPANTSGTDGDYEMLQMSGGRLWVDGSGVTLTTQLAAASNAVTTAYATNLVVKASAGTLYGLSGYNSKASAQFIQIHDAASLPSDAAVPKVTFTAAASSNFSIDFGPRGRAFTTGIVVCNSSTGPTKTIGSADIWVDAQYI